MGDGDVRPKGVAEVVPNNIIGRTKSDIHYLTG